MANPEAPEPQIDVDSYQTKVAKRQARKAERKLQKADEKVVSLRKDLAEVKKDIDEVTKELSKSGLSLRKQANLNERLQKLMDERDLLNKEAATLKDDTREEIGDDIKEKSDDLSEKVQTLEDADALVAKLQSDLVAAEANPATTPGEKAKLLRQLDRAKRKREHMKKEEKQKERRDEMARLEAEARVGEGDPNQNLKRDLEAVNSDDEPEDEPGKDAPETADGTAAEDGADTVATGDAEAISGLGETMNAASLGMARELVGAIREAKNKGEDSLGFKNTFYAFLLQALSSFTGKNTWVSQLTPKQLTILSDPLLGMKVQREGLNGKAVPDKNGKYKIEWTEGLEVNTAAMDVFEEAYGESEYLQKLEKVDEDTTLKDMVDSDDFDKSDALIVALRAQKATDETKVLDFIKKNRDDLMEKLTDASDEEDDEVAGSEPETIPAEGAAEETPAEEAETPTDEAAPEEEPAEAPAEAEDEEEPPAATEPTAAEAPAKPGEAANAEAENALQSKTEDALKVFVRMSPEQQAPYLRDTLTSFYNAMEQTDAEIVSPDSINELSSMMAILQSGTSKNPDFSPSFTEIAEKLRLRLEDVSDVDARTQEASSPYKTIIAKVAMARGAVVEEIGYA